MGGFAVLAVGGVLAVAGVLLIADRLDRESWRRIPDRTRRFCGAFLALLGFAGTLAGVGLVA